MVVLVAVLVILIGIATLFTVPSMPSVAAVHEYMHGKAPEQKCQR